VEKMTIPSEGLSLWLPTKDAKRLAVLAKDSDTSLADKLSALIQEGFQCRSKK
jgi:hypothetical protein